jgi:electron transfer flavoprotein beta subunit
MQIYVCVKHVPDTAATIRIAGDNGFDDTGCVFIINPYDEYAIEQAVQLVEAHGGEVIVVCVGKPDAVASVRSAMAMGAHRGILVRVDSQFLASRTTARALQAAIAQDGRPDIIFTGKVAVDTEGVQTPYRLAAAMDLPVVNEINRMELVDGKASVRREMGGGVSERLEVPLPCVLGATKGLNEPRYPTFRAIMKAKMKPIQTIDLANLQIPPEESGVERIALEKVPERGGARMIDGDVRQAAETLVRILKVEENVI